MHGTAGDGDGGGIEVSRADRKLVGLKCRITLGQRLRHSLDEDSVPPAAAVVLHFVAILWWNLGRPRAVVAEWMY